ncbi:MAG: hypothetical protein KDB14_08055 [Planctomycetales bacterium]|nr:hypothetical protein [Planctomycetales bacterium]
MRGFVLAGCVLLTTSVSAEDSPADAAARWLAELGKQGLVVQKTVKDGEPGFVASSGPGALGPVTRFSFQQSGWWVTVACKGKHGADASLDTLRKSFQYATIDRMPTPGLAFQGWEIMPRTPTSSITKGVKLVEFGEGRMKVDIQTGAFALTGRDTGILVPADAPAPPGSYFQIRKPFPIHVTISAPVKF